MIAAHFVTPGACSCSTALRGCVCAPEDLDDQLADFSAARLRADHARDRGDTIAERQYRDEQRRLGEQIRAALEPHPDTRADRHDDERNTADQLRASIAYRWTE